MDISERRVVGALLLLLGVSFVAIGVYSGQIEGIIIMLKTVFATG